MLVLLRGLSRAHRLRLSHRSVIATLRALIANRSSVHIAVILPSCSTQCAGSQYCACCGRGSGRKERAAAPRAHFAFSLPNRLVRPIADEAYAQDGGAGMPGAGMGGGRGGGGRRHLEDIVEGKLFLGGIEQDMSQEQLSNYCGGWYAPLPGLLCGRRLQVSVVIQFCFGTAREDALAHYLSLAQSNQVEVYVSQAYLQGSDYRRFCISQGFWLCDVR